MKAIEKFEKIMDKITMPIIYLSGSYLITRILVSFVFNV
jgi:hypothetical protein